MNDRIDYTEQQLYSAYEGLRGLCQHMLSLYHYLLRLDSPLKIQTTEKYKKSKI